MDGEPGPPPGAPKGIRFGFSETVNVYLFGERVFVTITKLRIIFWTTEAGP